MSKYLLLITLFFLSACAQLNTSGTTTNRNDDAKVLASARAMTVLGDVNAPITLTEFADYECPYCARFHNETFANLKTDYIDTGIVKFEFRDFPLGIHANAKNASTAAYCAGEQGKYWEMNDSLFANSNNLRPNDLKKYASKLKLNMPQYNSCLTSNKYLNVIRANTQLGQKGINKKGKFAVSGTPSFWINYDWSIVGAQPYSIFDDKLKQYLIKLKQQ